jgi:PAS domain S-box-containing protein
LIFVEKDMDEGMIQNNMLLEIVLDSIPIPIFYKNEKGHYLSCNTAYETFFGISRKYLAGKSVHEVFDKEYAGKFREMDLKLCRKPGRQVYESTVLDSNGLQREVIFHKATFLHPHGEVAGIVGAVLDTTELRATEKKLLGAKTSFNRVFDAIPDLLSVVDRDMRVIYSNWQGGHEYVAEDIRSNNPFCYDAYYPGQGKPCHPCHLLEVFRTGKPLITEKYNSRIGYLEVHAFPVLDESGNAIMAVEYLRNITGRKQAVDALRQTNHVLEAIINASPLAIIALDTDLKLTLWNHAAEEMFGWKKEEVLFKPYPIIPEDRIEEVQNNIRLLHKGEVRRSQETCRKRKDSSIVDVSLSTAVMPAPDGGVIGYMAIMSDITEHKRAQRDLRESEANYRAIFDAANDAIFVLDIETGNILDVNRKLCEMYGYTREEVLLLKVEDLSSGESPYTQKNAVKQIRKARNHKSHLFEWIAKDISGRLFWVEVNMRGAVIGGGYKALAVVRDITERKQAVQALRESEERFRQIYRRRRRRCSNPNSSNIFYS